MYLLLGLLQLPGDGDLYWQRWLGDLVLRSHALPTALGPETFTSAGAMWVPQEWLFSVIVALASHYNLFFLVTFALSATPLVILSLIYLRTRGGASAEAIGIVLLISGGALLESFGVRAQVLGWLMLAVFMFFIERRDRWYYAAFPTTVLWANLHASVALAPVIVLARLAAGLADGGHGASRRSRDLIMLGATILATFATPLGWRLPFYAVTLARSPIRHFIQEWQPPGLHDLSFMLGVLPLVLVILAAGPAFARRQLFSAAPSALLLAATLFAGRNIPLFVIVAAPLAARAIDWRFPRVRNLEGRVRDLAPAAVVAITVGIVISAFALLADERVSPPRLPIRAVASLAADRRSHRVFCQDFTWCSLALQYGNLRVFMDGRCDPYPVPVWQRYMATIYLKRPLSATLPGDAIDAIVAKRDTPFAVAVAKQPNWKQAFEDRSFVVYRRE
ncbi:MAG: hypothetical protein JO190_03830 [Candidatus Eremiobacteraeota bacterium]|nr:hypothetical protein [Candidatus Eremiobacteraeota bacterium]MBV8499279.1 hypothetical protein [Candidatus Eremiobacteraeota bacterium]